MTYQSEQQLEKTLIKQLGGLGFKFVKIEDATALIDNFKKTIRRV